MENHSLIERIKNGDGDDALKEIYSSYRNEFIRWAIGNHSCSMEEAKDIFQQSMIILYENVVYEKLTELTTQVNTYLFGIGKNKILELLRQKGRAVIQNEDKVDYESYLYGHEMDEGFEEKMRKVEAFISKMGTPCKNILEQYYYHKKSMQEISEILDYKSGDTVKTLKYKCLQRLKQIANSGLGTLN